MDMIFIIFLFLLWLISISPPAHSVSSPRGFPLSCGSSEELTQGNITYIPDEGFTLVGNKSGIITKGLLPILSTLRYFPDNSSRKYCYNFPVIKGGKYLVRTTYFYGGFDGGTKPPIFDQIIQGTKWSVVNTTEDYLNGLSTYYEIIILATSKELSVCVARNKRTTSYPFISALEVETLDDAMYNSTDFSKYALTSIARHTFGSKENIIGFPDDQFSRFWQPFTDENAITTSKSSVNPLDFWNLPPAEVFKTGITSKTGKKLSIQWPTSSLPNTKYYVALYFQDDRNPGPESWRVLSISINGRPFYGNLNVTTKGVNVYAKEWPLSGMTQITLTSAENMNVSPLVNAGEIFQIVPLAGRTLTKDALAMEDLARSLDNPPSDWSGDPCLPPQNSWTGVECSQNSTYARVVSLDLTNMGVSGTLTPSIDNLSALDHLWLGDNNLSGPIPNMGSLSGLQTLHLENNQLGGPIPNSLGQLKVLHELYLQNNQLTGKIPASLRRNDLDLQVTGNNLAA
ncbi:putative leucine-rich repeat receptor-like serine/threonine-protein kinase At2g14440 [Euphorbia lathyris]|uniref:putative leucine-rich repeat receptor-like serine/threonine-protein kinase At2g14440 n=1 Tax=Euphorbia lathyris TaxID=212925 RepID=UPI00331423AF